MGTSGRLRRAPATVLGPLPLAQHGAWRGQLCLLGSSPPSGPMAQGPWTRQRRPPWVAAPRKCPGSPEPQFPHCQSKTEAREGLVHADRARPEPTRLLDLCPKPSCRRRWTGPEAAPALGTQVRRAGPWDREGEASQQPAAANSGERPVATHHMDAEVGRPRGPTVPGTVTHPPGPGHVC